MWKAVVKNNKSGRPTRIDYRLKCDICGNLFKQHGEVVRFTNIQSIDEPNYYGWFVLGDGALCPDCRRGRVEEDEEMEVLNIKSFATWCKKNKIKKTVVVDRYGCKKHVWPTLKEHGFKIYNKDPDIRFFNEKTKDTVYRVIDRGGSPLKRVKVSAIEFVYSKVEGRLDDEIAIFWRKAK